MPTVERRDRVVHGVLGEARLPTKHDARLSKAMRGIKGVGAEVRCHGRERVDAAHAVAKRHCRGRREGEGPCPPMVSQEAVRESGARRCHS